LENFTFLNKQYHFMTSFDRFPVPIRLVVKSNLTICSCQNLPKRASNALTVQALMTELGKLAPNIYNAQRDKMLS